MKETGGVEIRVLSHIVLVIAVTVFSLTLIGLDLFRGWESWTIPLLAAAPVACLVMHVLRRPEEGLRVYFYSFILFLEIFYYSVHSDGFFDCIPLVMLTLAFLAMTREIPLLWVCIFVGILGVLVRILEYCQISGQMISPGEIIKCLWNFLLVIATGMAIKKMLKSSEEAKLVFLEKYAALEQDTKRADSFLANISNEIKTPVDEVIRLSMESGERETDQSIKENLERISYTGHKVAEQIGDILDYSELEMNRISVTEEEYRLSDLLTELVEELRLFKKDETELVIDVNPLLPAVMKSDTGKLKRVLWHVILNALKYTERGGVYVRITYTEQAYGINLCVDVADPGGELRQRVERRVLVVEDEVCRVEVEEDAGMVEFLEEAAEIVARLLPRLHEDGDAVFAGEVADGAHAVVELAGVGGVGVVDEAGVEGEVG